MIYYVKSSDWEVQVESDSFEEAAILGTEKQLEEVGIENFTLSFAVFVSRQEDDEIMLYSCESILLDLGLYNESRHFKEFLDSLKNT